MKYDAAIQKFPASVSTVFSQQCPVFHQQKQQSRSLFSRAKMLHLRLMKPEIINNIKLLHQKIDEYKTALRQALTVNESYDTLKNMRSHIRLYTEELSKLELTFGVNSGRNAEAKESNVGR